MDRRFKRNPQLCPYCKYNSYQDFPPFVWPLPKSPPSSLPPTQLTPTSPIAPAFSHSESQSKFDSDEQDKLMKRNMFLRIMANIREAKTPAGRKAALASGLMAPYTDDQQREMKLLVSQLDIAAVVERVKALKTPAAKRRHLLGAIESIKADDLPDELQARELETLKVALSCLETEVLAKAKPTKHQTANTKNAPADLEESGEDEAINRALDALIKEQGS